MAGTCDWDTDTGWVARENQKPGASAKWDDGAPVRMGGDFSRRVELKRIEGWFGTTSAQCGQNVALRISWWIKRDRDKDFDLSNGLLRWRSRTFDCS
jgi:hypothetical protein